MKILVTGSKGQVGRAIAKHSKDSKYTFHFTDRETLDIGNQEEVEAYILGLKPKIIINTAAYTAVDKAEEDADSCHLINAKALEFLSLANNQLKQPAFIIHISTDYVYHPKHDNLITEAEPTNPQSVYAQTKLEGEKLLSQYSDQFTIIRTSWVYDEDGHNFVNTMDRLGGQKDKLNVVNDQVGSPTYAGDIADIIMRIVEKIGVDKLVLKENSIMNFSNEGFTNWAEFAEEIMRIQKHDCKIHPIPTTQYPTPAKRPLNSRLDKSLIKEVLRIEIPHWKESLAKCLQKD
jgi:dTDP-4-dehydrorhamnose reductase